ncbi:MAG: YcnI family protein, partial [Actinomycetota bacterium]
EIPQDHPITSVSVAPVPGWTYKVERSKLATPLKDDDGNTISEAVSKVSWEGGQIKPGEFVEFPVSMGPLPEDADSLTFKAIQTYSSGEVVRWIEVREEGKPEPDHPAPLVKLVSAGGGSAAAPTPSPTATAAATEASGTMGDKTGIILGVIAIVLSLVALLRSGRSSGRKAAA